MDWPGLLSIARPVVGGQDWTLQEGMMGKTKGPREAGPNAELQTGAHAEGGISSNGKELPDALQLHLDKVLEAIKTTREALEHKIDSVVIDVGLLRADHKKVAEKVETNKLLLADIQPKVGDNTENIAKLTEKMEVLERKMEDLEGRDRRSNIRVIGLPEGTEDSDMVKFLENWIREEVAGDALSSFVALERAHRVPGRRPQPGMPARSIVAKLLHYRDRDTILQKARDHGDRKSACRERV